MRILVAAIQGCVRDPHRLNAAGWADADNLADLIVHWNVVAERHFPAYRVGETTFQGQRRRRLLDFLPRVGIDATQWSNTELDDVFAAYLGAYEAAWQPFADVVPCLEAIRPLAAIAVLSNGDQAQQEDKVRRTGLAHTSTPSSPRTTSVSPSPTRPFLRRPAFTWACRPRQWRMSATGLRSTPTRLRPLGFAVSGLIAPGLSRP